MAQEKAQKISSIPAVIVKRTKEFTTKSLQLLKGAEAFSVKNDADFLFAADQLKEVRSYLRSALDEQKKITQPMNAALAAVRALFKTPLERLKAADAAWSTCTSAYLQEQETRRMKLIEKQEIAVEKKALKLEEQGKDDKAQEIREALVPAAREAATPKVVGLQFRTEYAITLIDTAAIPRQYLSADITLIRKAVEDAQGALEIPGVLITKKKIPVMSK